MLVNQWYTSMLDVDITLKSMDSVTTPSQNLKIKHLNVFESNSLHAMLSQTLCYSDGSNDLFDFRGFYQSTYI